MASIETANGVISIENPTYTLLNPIFDTENTDRQYSLPFKIALTDAHKQVLMNAQRIDSIRSNNRIAAILRLKSLHIEGVLSLDSNDDKAIEATFQSEVQKVFEVLENMQVHDILGTHTVPQMTVPHLYMNVNNYNTSTYSITINDVTYSVSTSQTGFSSRLTEMQNLRDAILIDYPTLDIQVTASSIEINNTAYLALKIEGYIAGLAVTSAANINEARTSNFVAFLKDNYEHHANSGIVFPAFWCENAYGENTPNGFTPYINRIHRQNTNINIYMPNFALDAKGISEYTFVPFIKVAYVLNKIGIALGRNIEFDCGALTADFNNMLIFNNKTLDVIPRADWYVDNYSDNMGQATAAVQRFYNHFQTTIVLSNHIQKTTAKAFMQLLCAAFCLKIEVTADTIYLRPKRNINTSTTKIEGNILAVSRKIFTKNGITITHSPIDSDAKSNTFEPFAIRQGLTKVALPFYTFPNIQGLTVYEMPHTEGGLHSVQSNSKGGYGWAFLIDKGEVEGAQGGVYYRQCSYKGSQMWLSIAEANGLYAKLFANIIEYNEADTVEIAVTVDSKMAAHLIDFNNAKIYATTQNGALEGIIKSIDITESKGGDFILRLETKIL